MLGGLLPNNSFTKIVLWVFVIVGGGIILWMVFGSFFSDGVSVSLPPPAET